MNLPTRQNMRDWRNSVYLRAGLFSIGGALLMIVIGLQIFLFVRPIIEPPPYQAQPLEVLSPPAVCAGDQLIYRVHVSLRNTPATITFTDTWWNSKTNRTAKQATAQRFSNFPTPFESTLTTSVTVPIDLLPGQYLFLRSGQAQNSELFMYQVPVEVKECL